MPDDTRNTSLSTYENPVYPGSFPDPYILKFRGEFFAFCTGHWHDGRVFGILRSRDLVNWEDAGGAMEPLDDPSPFYWAPEVSYSNGKFYLYYSVGNEVLMHLRVAVSDRPDGGYLDAGRRLTSEEFAIDAHVFTDGDGTRYMFYATDFLEHTHIGTGTVVDRMVDWLTLAGEPTPVTRAKYDWQVYDPARKEKGGVRWHTVEGPFVLKRKGVYYEMFSGGNWQNTTYGVSFARSRDIIAPDEWEQHADGEEILPILRTMPPKVLGPGHNSVVRGPNNRELYCVYHSWTDHGRVLSIDRMDFAGDRMFVHGPTTDPQPSPHSPAVRGFSEAWFSEGSWNISSHSAASSGNGECSLTFRRSFPAGFLVEVYFRFLNGTGKVAIGVLSEARQGFEVRIDAGSHEFSLDLPDGRISRPLPADMDLNQYQLLRIDRSGRRIKLALNGIIVADEICSSPPTGLVLRSSDSSVEFANPEITDGFEDLFDSNAEPEVLGWQIEGGSASVNNGEMRIEPTENQFTAQKGGSYSEYEFACNVRGQDGPGYGFALRTGSGETIDQIMIDLASGLVSAGAQRFTLPPASDPSLYHQFRFLITRAQAVVYFDDAALGEIAMPGVATHIALVSGNTLSVEMARLTVF